MGRWGWAEPEPNRWGNRRIMARRYRGRRLPKDGKEIARELYGEGRSSPFRVQVPDGDGWRDITEAVKGIEIHAPSEDGETLDRTYLFKPQSILTKGTKNGNPRKT